MHKTLTIYPGWFTDEHSYDVCTEFNLPVIPAKRWIEAEYVYRFPLPDDFTLFEYATSNHIDVVFFMPMDDIDSKDYHNAKIYPATFFRFTKNTLRKRIRDAIKYRL